MRGLERQFSTYCVPPTVVGSQDTGVNKTKDRVLNLMEPSGERQQNKNQVCKYNFREVQI